MQALRKQTTVPLSMINQPVMVESPLRSMMSHWAENMAQGGASLGGC